jgi:hypothetical protein
MLEAIAVAVDAMRESMLPLSESAMSKFASKPLVPALFDGNTNL